MGFRTGKLKDWRDRQTGCKTGGMQGGGGCMTGGIEDGKDGQEGSRAARREECRTRGIQGRRDPEQEYLRTGGIPARKVARR